LHWIDVGHDLNKAESLDQARCADVVWISFFLVKEVKILEGGASSERFRSAKVVTTPIGSAKLTTIGRGTTARYRDHAHAAPGMPCPNCNRSDPKPLTSVLRILQQFNSLMDSAAAIGIFCRAQKAHDGAKNPGEE